MNNLGKQAQLRTVPSKLGNPLFVISRSPVRSRRVAPELIHKKPLTRLLPFHGRLPVPKPRTKDAAVPKHEDGSTSLKCEGLSQVLGRVSVTVDSQGWTDSADRQLANKNH